MRTLTRLSGMRQGLYTNMTALRAGIHPPLGASPPRRHYRALPEGSGFKVQLRKDDLPQVLRASAATSDQLPQEEVWTHQSAPTEEEAEVSGTSNGSTASGTDGRPRWMNKSIRGSRCF